MKKILIFILILLMFKVKGQTPQAPIIFSTIAQMQAYTGSYYQAWVNDTIQGGMFKGILSGTLYVDSGVVFQGVGRQWQRQITQGQALNGGWWGVRGDSSDQTQALTHCWNYAKRPIASPATNLKGNLGLINISLPAGIILYKGTGLTIDSGSANIARGIKMWGQGIIATRISIPDTTVYLIDVDGAVNYMDIEYFQMDGGAGLFRQRAKFLAGTGMPTAKKIFRNLDLSNYRVCAIGSNLNNDSHYNISMCKFDGGVNSMAIFLAPGGAHDVYQNWIRGGRTFVAMRDENDTRVFDNRLAGSNPQFANGGRQIIWVIADPDTALNQKWGQGVEIHNNFLGNEASNPYDVPIFVSYADTSSNPDHINNPNWGSYFPLFKPVTDPLTILRGMSIYNNTWNVDSGHMRGIIYSEVQKMTFSYYNNFLYGDFPYLLQMDSNFTSFAANNNWIQSCYIDMSRPDFKAGSQQNLIACNLQGFGLIYDPQHLLKASSAQLEFPAASDYQYQVLNLDTFRVLNDATIDTLSYGVDSLKDMNEITFTADSGQVSARIINENTASPYKQTWLEVDVKAPSTHPVKELKIEVDSTAASSIHSWMIAVPVPAEGTVTGPLPFLFPINTGQWVVKVSLFNGDWSATTNRIKIGRMRMYQSSSRKVNILPPFLATSASGNKLARTSVGTITTVTSATTDNTYDIAGYINVTAIATDSIQAQVTYTDINSNSVTAIMPLLKQSTGVSSTKAGATGQYSFGLRSIRVKASTAITVLTTLPTSGGSITFDCGAYINFITTNSTTVSP